MGFRRKSGIVDEEVKPSEGLDGELDGLIRRRRIGRVASYDSDLVAGK